jgi:hypothetical protein
MGSNSKPRVVLQFNEMDFRHRRALDILRKRPRSMSELVVNAILYYTSCPVAANEFGRDWVVSIVHEKTHRPTGMIYPIDWCVFSFDYNTEGSGGVRSFGHLFLYACSRI